MPFEELKERMRVAWGAAPFENIEDSLAVMHDDLVARLDPQPGQKWLDVGCGAGAVAMRAARAGADVTGVDLSDVMVETARRRAREEGLDIAYDVGDAENLPYADASFEVVSSSVGIFLAPDHRAVALGLTRVVRPGGRLGLTAWRPGSRVERGVKLSARFQPPPPEGVGNPFDWGTEEHVGELLGEAFDLEFHEGDAPDRGPSGEAIWEYLLAGVGPMRMLYESLEPDRREEFHRAAVEMYEEDRVGDEIVMPGPYLLTLGRRK
jgi:SAM-dependent methyltransferase